MARKKFLVTLKNNGEEEKTLVVCASGRKFAVAKARVLCPGFQPTSFTYTTDSYWIDEFNRTGIRPRSRYDHDTLLRFQ